MRKIKFRAWDIKTKTILYDVCPCRYLDNENFVLQQYTGLLDDRGKEIYEGDIVRLHNAGETKSPYISQVYWTYDGALVDGHPAHLKMGAGPRYRNLSEYCSYGVCEETMCSCEVIGNVHKNPDMV